MGESQRQVVASCLRQDCVTLCPMALGAVADRVVIEEVAALADSFADYVLADLATVTCTKDLRDGLSGSYLVFLREAVLLANSCRD